MSFALEPSFAHLSFDIHIYTGLTNSGRDLRGGCVVEVFKIGWWMAHYHERGQGSPKRHLGLTNNVWADKLNKGKLTKAVRDRCKVKTTERYTSKSTGKPGYKGSSALKATQRWPQYTHGNFHAKLLNGYFLAYPEVVSATLWQSYL